VCVCVYVCVTKASKNSSPFIRCHIPATNICSVFVKIFQGFSQQVDLTILASSHIQEPSNDVEVHDVQEQVADSQTPMDTDTDQCQMVASTDTKISQPVTADTPSKCYHLRVCMSSVPRVVIFSDVLCVSIFRYLD